MLNRRLLLLTTAASALPALACAQTPRVYAIDIRRDAGCGCCHTWATLLQRTGRFETTLTEDADMSAHKDRLGVPEDLRSCHTGVVEGYVIEGHVPAEDILGLLQQSPRDVLGLAVPGMPIGSPGMEIPSGRRDAYEVIAFLRQGGTRVFSRYEASA